MEKEKGMIIKHPKLTKNQEILYALIVKKVESNEPIYFKEAREMWINHVCREIRDGKPHYFNFWWRNEKDEMVGRYQPMNEYMISLNATQWLVNNIGRLVLKGYLKVIPQIEIKQLTR